MVVSDELKDSCEDIRKQSDASSIYHVNALSGDGIFEAFEDFVSRILEDQEENHRNDGDLVDDLWDESIRVK